MTEFTKIMQRSPSPVSEWFWQPVAPSLMDTSSLHMSTWPSTPACAWASLLSEKSTRLGLFHTISQLCIKLNIPLIEGLWHTLQQTTRHNYGIIQHSGKSHLSLYAFDTSVHGLARSVLMSHAFESCNWRSLEMNTTIPERWGFELVSGCLTGYWATNKANPGELMRLRWIVIATARPDRLPAQFGKQATPKFLKINRLHSLDGK